MKKVLSILLLLAMILTLCACGHKKTTCKEFVSLMQSKGYAVEQMNDAPEGGEGYKAHNEDDTFVLYFYETGKEVYAYNAFYNDLDEFESMGGGGSSTRSTSESFGYASRRTGDVFKVSSYIESTYLSGYTTPDQADAMKEIFKELGYN